MGRGPRSLVQKLMRAADSPIFELPKSWHALSRYRSAEMFLKHPAPPVVRYNDSNIYKNLAKEFPQVKLQPLRVNAAQPSLAARLVQEHQYQLKLEKQQPKQQQSERQPWQQPALQAGPQQKQQGSEWRISHKLQQELARAGEAGGTGYLSCIQQQEEEALQTALSKLKQQDAEGRKS